MLMLVVAAILSTCQGATPPRTEPPSSSAAGCAFPSVRPTYLPWIGPGEAVPAPLMNVETTEEDGSYAILDWRNPHWKDNAAPYYVILRRQSEPNLSAPGEPVEIRIEGSDPGDLYEGKLSGETSIYWVVPNLTSCSTIALDLVAPDMTRSDAKRAIIRIARSLRPVPDR